MRFWCRLPEGLVFRTPEGLIATWFGAGLLRPLPGTCGSLAALPLGWVLYLLGGSTAIALAAIAIFLLGSWACDKLLADLHAEHDHDLPGIVVDEVAGQLVALIPAALTPEAWLVAFLAFRLFDMWKPWPIRLIDRRVAGTPGIMCDDIVAGIAAAVVVWLTVPLL